MENTKYLIVSSTSSELLTTGGLPVSSLTSSVETTGYPLRMVECLEIVTSSSRIGRRDVPTFESVE